jgi:hypothetical protein
VFTSDGVREEILELPLPPRSVRNAVFGPVGDDGTPRYPDAALPPMPVAPESSADRAGFGEAQLAPEFDDGEIIGIRISAIVPNSAYHRLGFKNGDLITSIGGTAVSNPLRALRSLRELREQERGAVGITRRQRHMVLDLGAELEAAAARALQPDEGTSAAWDWKGEAAARSIGRSMMPERVAARFRRGGAERRGISVRVSSPRDWDERGLAMIPVLRSGELSSTDEPLARGDDPEDEDLVPITVTDMRSVHAAARSASSRDSLKEMNK